MAEGEREIEASLRGEMLQAGERLAERLRDEPAGWAGVWDAFLSIEQVKHVKKALDSMAGGDPDPGAEEWFVGRLHEGPTAKGRRIAVYALGLRKTGSSLQALKTAAAADPSDHVRVDAIMALHRRRVSGASEADQAALIQFLRTRAATDPSPMVKKTAHRFTPEGAPPPPPPSRRRSRIR